jgi:radical SAM protein with 4Fe4S-binding SPASM domain
MVTHPDTRKTWNPQHELTIPEIVSTTRQTLPWSMITVTGGEPFVRKDIMDLLGELTRLRPTHLVTNATLVTKEQSHWLVNNAANSMMGRGLATIGISLEGPASLHDRVVGVPGSYEKAMSFVQHVVETRRSRGAKLPLVDIKIVLSRDNWEALPAFRRELASTGVDLVTVQIQNNQVSAYGIPADDLSAHLKVPPPVETIPASAIEPLLRILTDEGKRAPGRIRYTPPIPLSSIVAHYNGNLTPSCLDCHATWTTAHVGPYGDLFPCFSYSMGNIRNNSLMKIWNGLPYRQFRTALKRAQAFPGCVGCCMASPSSDTRCTA